MVSSLLMLSSTASAEENREMKNATANKKLKRWLFMVADSNIKLIGVLLAFFYDGDEEVNMP